MKRTFATIKIGNKSIDITLQEVVIFKTILTICLLSVYFLPAHVATPVSAATNLLWLWRG